MASVKDHPDGTTSGPRRCGDRRKGPYAQGVTSLPAPPAAQQERSRRTRRTLLDAGFRLLEQRGPEALTIAAVSAAAGVAPGTVYRRFGDKEGLLTELQEEFTAGMRDEVGQRMSRGALRADAAPAAAVDVAVRALVDTFRSREALLRVFMVLGLREPSVLDIGSRASQEGGRHFRDLLWPHRDAFTAADPERAIDVAHRLVYATCTHRVLHGPTMESPTTLTWDELADEVSRTVALSLLGTLPGT
jgi:AcrR family transcriptional regulator